MSRSRGQSPAPSRGPGRGEGRILEILDTAYDTDLDEHTWVARLAEAFAPLLDDGSGVHAMIADPCAPRLVRDPILVGGDADWQARWKTCLWDEHLGSAPPETIRAMLRFSAVSHSTELSAALAPSIDTLPPASRLAREGFEDSLNIVCTDVTGLGVVLVANRRRRRPLRPAQRRCLTRLASHVAAAARLRRRVGARDAIPEADAIASAVDGRVLHAVGSVSSRRGLSALRDAVRSVMHARAHRVDDPMSHWRALHEGRWTIVERFESDGHRVLIARENRADPLALPGLTRKEGEVIGQLALGHSNKEIAYRLGVSTSTVSVHAQRAARKLGARSIRDLVRRARAALDSEVTHD